MGSYWTQPAQTVEHAATHENAGSDELNVTGLSGQLADPQIAAAHASTHNNGGSDPVTVTSLAGYPGGTTNFLRADGTFAVPPGGGGGAPDPHAASHQNAGSDEISVAGLSGVLADPQTPAAHKTTHQNGGADEISVAGLNGLLADPQTPLGHLASHHAGGGDTVNVTQLGGYPGGTATFLRADGSFATPSGIAPSAHATTHQPGGSDAMAVDAAPATGSLRTLGTGASQAAAGNDARLTNSRTPTAHATSHQPGGADPMAVDAAAATGSLRTLGTGANQAAAGNDSRFGTDNLWSASGTNISNTNSGNVGIGTSTPSNKLEVAGGNISIYSGGLLSVGDGGATYMTRGHPDINAGELGTLTNSPQLFITNSTEKMRIDTDGDVGIGTSDPQGKLDVAGRLHVRDRGDGHAEVRLNSAASLPAYLHSLSDGSFDIYTNFQERMRIDSSGNMGIGTPSPAAKLHVTGPVRSTDAGGATFHATSHASLNVGEVGTLSASPQIFITNSAERMRIDASGNVGIGTTAPDEKLQISNGRLFIGDRGDGNQSEMRIGYGYTNQTILYGLPTGYFSIYKFGGTGVGDVLTILHDGNIGIGTTTPALKLDVNGNMRGVICESFANPVPMGVGEVAIFNPSDTNQIIRTTTAYDTRVIGVVVAWPSAGIAHVARHGRVNVLVEATTAPIAAGDWLVTSTTAGRAMHSEPVSGAHRAGTLLGKALGSLGSGLGTLTVLLGAP